MIDFIPLVDYTPFFDYSILILVLIAFWQCNTGIILHKNIVSMNAVWGVLFTVLLILYGTTSHIILFWRHSKLRQWFF